jgi:fructokinase
VIDVIGEALVDLVEDDDGRFVPVPGGGPANVAVALGRLGMPVRMLARFGDDGFGRRSRERLADSGVRLDAAVDSDRSSTIAIASRTSDGSARYAFAADGTADWQWRADELPADAPTALHMGSLALAIGQGAGVIEDHARRLRELGTTTISYDPNVRPALGFDRVSERTRVERQCVLAHLVKASEDDLDWIYPDSTLDEQVARLRSAGVEAAIVVTRGSQGAVLDRLRRDRLMVGAPPTRVVDTIGAGDSLAAGLLAWLDLAGVLGVDPARRLAGASDDLWRAALEFAVVHAARTCERAGADPVRLDLSALVAAR